MGALVFAAASLTACGGSDAVESVGSAACATARSDALELRVVDVWGRPLPDARLDVVDLGGVRAPLSGGGSVVWTTPGPLALRVDASAAGHVNARVLVTLPGAAFDAVRATPDSGDGATHVAVSRGFADADGALECAAPVVFVGLEDGWFAPSGPAPSAGNALELLMDGEEFWGRLRDDLTRAASHVEHTTWWWQSDFELVRPEAGPPEDPIARRAHTILGALEQLTRVRKRILVSRFGGEALEGLAYVNTDGAIRERARVTDDDIEMMSQANRALVPLSGRYDPMAPAVPFAARLGARPEGSGRAWEAAVQIDASGAALQVGASGAASETQPLQSAVEAVEAATWHQKLTTIDGRVALVTGMNTKSTDWDTSAYRVFDPRRMRPAASQSERDDVAAARVLPDFVPRKDYGVRIVGPAVRDVETLFARRWRQALDDRELFWEGATPFAPEGPAPDAESGGVTLQVVATLPPPWRELSTLETWRKAIGRAQHTIFVEDQYWRMEALADLLAERLRAVPELRLVVVTIPIADTDGGKQWSVLFDQQIRAAAGERYLLMQLEAFDWQRGDGGVRTPTFVPIFTHSKLLIVDDVYVQVGSANKNNRSLLYDGELGVAVVDTAWARQARRRIYEGLVGPALAGELSDEPIADFELLRSAAERNARAKAALEAAGPAAAGAEPALEAPRGIVYPLDFGDDWLLEVSPDLY